jgi:hypothetical protein
MEEGAGSSQSKVASEELSANSGLLANSLDPEIVQAATCARALGQDRSVGILASTSLVSFTSPRRIQSHVAVSESEAAAQDDALIAWLGSRTAIQHDDPGGAYLVRDSHGHSIYDQATDSVFNSLDIPLCTL